MDTARRYIELVRLGREDFLDAAAPAALVRWRRRPLSKPKRPMATVPQLSKRNGLLDSPDDDDDATMKSSLDELLPRQDNFPVEDVEVYPLAKKPGAAFASMITVGRTPNNDVVLADVTVSRFHAYFRRDGDGDDAWFVCDAGSKNGTRLSGSALPSREDHAVRSRDTVRFGDVETTFYAAADLFELLSQTPTQDC